MLWVDAANAGFTSPEAKPWLPLMVGWATRNAKTQSEDGRSLLNLYRRLLALRRAEPALHRGAISEVGAEGTVLRYCRREAGTAFQVLLNLGAEPAEVNSAKGRVVLTTLLDGEGAAVDGGVTLEAGEGLLIALE